MKRNGFLLIILLLMPFFTERNITAQEVLEISVQSDKPGAEIQSAMWGVFFEDINFAADGGIYAELVKNRSFEFELPMTGWRTISNPKLIYPVSTTVKVAGRKINAVAEPLSVSIFIIDFKSR